MAIQLQPTQHVSVSGGEPTITGSGQYRRRRITALSREVLVEVFTHLSAGDLLACGQVNRRWQRIIVTEPTLACTFCRGLQPLPPIPLPLPLFETTVENYHAFIRDQLREFDEAGNQAVMRLDHVLAQQKPYFPEQLCFSLAHVLNGAKRLYGMKILTRKSWRTITDTRFSSDEHHLVTAMGWKVKVCRQVNGQWQKAPTLKHFAKVHSTCFSPDRIWLAVTCKNNVVFLYRAVDNQWRQQTTVSHCYHWFDPCFSADGQYLVTASTGHFVRLHLLVDRQWRRLLSRLDGQQVGSVCFHPRENLLVTTAFDRGTVAIWRLANERVDRAFRCEDSTGMASARLSASGNHLLLTRACGPTMQVHIWQGGGQSWEQTDNFPLPKMDSANFSPGENYLVTLPDKPTETARIIPIGKTKWPQVVIPDFYKMTNARFNSGDDRLVTLSRDTRNATIAFLWRCVDREWRLEVGIPHSAMVLDARFSFYGNVVTCTHQVVKICGHNGTEWKKKAHLPHKKWVTNAKFSPLGRYLFTLTGDESGNKTTTIWMLSGNAVAPEQRRANVHTVRL